jgi:hypothetical protein
LEMLKNVHSVRKTMEIADRTAVVVALAVLVQPVQSCPET